MLDLRRTPNPTWCGLLLVVAACGAEPDPRHDGELDLARGDYHAPAVSWLPPTTGAVATPDLGTARPPPSVASPPGDPFGLPEDTEPGVIVVAQRSVEGVVEGLVAGTSARVILSSDAWLEARTVVSGERYRFDDLPDGRYTLKLDVTGHRSPPTRTIVIAADAAQGFAVAAQSVDLAAEPLPAGEFSYLWQEDESRAGHQETAYVVTPPVVAFLDEEVPIPELAAADELLHDYHVVLSDEEEPWSQEHAYRLLRTLRAVPTAVRSPYGLQQLPPSKWVLSKRALADDLEVRYGDAGDLVRVSADAFAYAAPRLVDVDGVRGSFFSKRLHHAVVRYLTRDGSDLAAVERILNERFGCSTLVPDYQQLTSRTTGEDAGSFQPFHAEELVAIIDMFEEMPDGLHALGGLRWLVRRTDGVPHPWYDAAPAVSWPSPSPADGDGYLEFMASAFTTDPHHMHRLILHEKAHFLWAGVLSASIRDEWVALGGWFLDDAAPSGWSTTSTTEFVSAYAHAKNPDEDLAETIADFVLNPELVRSRAPDKFSFVRDRIMHGTRYLSRIDEALTFEVLNLFPDFTYPGKITRVAVRAEGLPEDDKLVTIEIGLHTDDAVFAGASHAYTRIFSEVGTYVDLYLQPVDQAGSVLRGQFVLSRHAKAGSWRAPQIVVTDQVGNQRLEGVNDFGWRLHIDNPLEDLEAPRYLPGSMALTLLEDVVEQGGVSHGLHRVRATWRVEENGTLQAYAGVYAALAAPGTGYAIESYGTWAPTEAPGIFEAAVELLVTDHRLSGDYGAVYARMVDVAGNTGEQRFSDSPLHQPLVSIAITTTQPDTTRPEVCLVDDPSAGLHAITIEAAPTQPEAPNGETVVDITFLARDDLSGIGQMSYRLLDPQGISHFQYAYHANFWSTFFDGDPTAWAEYRIDVVLPVGSPPGIWGLQELVLSDKAGNRRSYDFVETLRFDVAL